MASSSFILNNYADGHHFNASETKFNKNKQRGVEVLNKVFENSLFQMKNIKKMRMKYNFIYYLL